MPKSAYLFVLIALLIGCANEPGKGEPADDASDQTAKPASATLTATDPEYQWAVDLINDSSQWDAVTAAAIPADYTRYGLCRRRIPGVDDHGPHSANYESWESEYVEEPDKSPANQFIVNSVGRGSFYDIAGQADKTATQPPPLPVGTVIIKEKYDLIDDAKTRSNPKAFGVMMKHEHGYDTDHGDWEYAYIELDKPGTITGAIRGKLANCIDCHANRKHTDYVFRNYPLLSKTK